MAQPDTNTHRPQFSLQTLFAVVSLSAVLFAAVVALGHEIALGFSGFILSCVFVIFVAITLMPLAAATKIPFPMTLILIPALYCLLELAFLLFGEAIDQPHPAYVRGNWVTVALANALPGLPFMAIAMFVLVGIDAAVQTSRPRDIAYFPRVTNVRAIMARFELRLAVIIGVMLVLGYYALTVVDVWHNEQLSAGLVWPPKRVFVACNFLWGILWIAECQTRPTGGTRVAAIGFLALTFLFLLPMGLGVLRE